MVPGRRARGGTACHAPASPSGGLFCPYGTLWRPFSGHIGRRGSSRARRCGEELRMLWTILVVLIVLWALGLLASVGGAAIHLLLVLALVVLVAQLLSGRRSVY